MRSSTQPNGHCDPRERSGLSSISNRCLRDWLGQSLVLLEDWQSLAEPFRGELNRETDPHRLADLLVEHGLLTDYQARRIHAGKVHGLVLGNYRVLDRLGAGGMAIVFMAEHVRLRQPTAVKVLPLAQTDEDEYLLTRFVAEMRAVARLQHPNIVPVIDAGELAAADPDSPPLHYFVMPFVPGEDLQSYVEQRGPLSVAKACDLMHQTACALAEAHRNELVHRDVKPANIMVTPEGQAKLLDFGLARHRQRRVTTAGTLLGTVDYMAPEQARDSSAVDGRADIFSLGATFYFCLTGHKPFPPHQTLIEDLTSRMAGPPPSLRARRPDVAPELDALLTRMMAVNPDDRPSSASALMEELLPFYRSSEPVAPLLRAPALPGAVDASTMLAGRIPALLVVDDEADLRTLIRLCLQADNYEYEEAANGAEALAALQKRPFDLVLLDVDMPRMGGLEVLRRLRAQPLYPHLKIVMISGRASGDEMATMLLAGADDYLTKPFSFTQLQARIKVVLNLKAAQDRADSLAQQLLAANADLERTLAARDSNLVQLRNALVLAVAKLVEYRTTETPSHLLRVQRYCRLLAEEAANRPTLTRQITPDFLQALECCAPLHDIGKAGLPDHILMKPGKLEPEERLVMQAHTVLGANALQKVAQRYGSAVAFLHMAIDIARHHHERWDGNGYPDRLAGENIPLAARIETVGDVYDALRRRQTFRPAFSHAAAVEFMSASSGHFDPVLLETFQRSADRFEQVFRELPDEMDL